MQSEITPIVGKRKWEELFKNGDGGRHAAYDDTGCHLDDTSGQANAVFVRKNFCTT